MRLIVRARTAGAAAVAVAVAVTGAFTAPASSQTPAPPQVSGWRTPDPSTEQSPAVVLGETDGPVRLSVVKASARGPVTTSEVLPDRSAALAAVQQAQDDSQVLAVEKTGRVRLLAADPMRPSQWALDTLRADSVWPTSTGSGVTVAVVDTGVYADHADLGRSEAGGQVLVGADCTTASTCSGTGRSDGHGHGTHVSGIIAAKRDNGVGVAGLAPEAKILPVKVLDAGGYGTFDDVANGVRYAANNGADVINLSLGGSYNSAALSTAIDYARAQGVIVAAAAGNGGSGASPSYPGALPTVIGVAATDSNDGIAWFSTRGGYVDVAAPGDEVLSTLPWGYDSWSGTSMATPYVAATIALMQEERAGLTAAEAADVLETTATDLGASGRDSAFGYGRINPVEAVQCVLSDCAGAPRPVERAATGLHFVPLGRPKVSATGTSTVRVRLTRRLSGAPVAGATTRLTIGPPARTADEAVTDLNGVARFEVVNPGRSWVRACFAGDSQLRPDCTAFKWLRRI